MVTGDVLSPPNKEREERKERERREEEAENERAYQNWLKETGGSDNPASITECMTQELNETYNGANQNNEHCVLRVKDVSRDQQMRLVALIKVYASLFLSLFFV